MENSSSNTSNTSYVWITGIAGAILLGVSLYLFFQAIQYTRNGVHATATVVDNVFYNQTGKMGSITYPVLKFQTKTGETIETESKSAQLYKDSYPLDSTVDIYYETANPKNVWIEGFWQQWFVPGILLVLGGFMFFAAYIMRF